MHCKVDLETVQQVPWLPAVNVFLLSDFWGESFQSGDPYIHNILVWRHTICNLRTTGWWSHYHGIFFSNLHLAKYQFKKLITSLVEDFIYAVKKKNQYTELCLGFVIFMPDALYAVLKKLKLFIWVVSNLVKEYTEKGCLVHYTKVHTHIL